jgi:hypothetical protein
MIRIFPIDRKKRKCFLVKTQLFSTKLKATYHLLISKNLATKIIHKTIQLSKENNMYHSLYDILVL